MEKKKILGTIGAMALTAAIAITGTFAYLTSVTDTKENKFTSAGNISGEVVEDNWEYGENGWTDYLPGQSTAKDPVVKIDNDGVAARIAMKIVCVGADGTEMSLEEFQQKYATVSYKGVNGINTTSFDQYENTDLYIYKDVVQPGESSAAIFDKVTVNTGIYRTYGSKTAEQTIVTYKVDENGNKIEGSETTTKGQVIVDEETKVFVKNADGSLTEVTADAALPSFEIKVTGYAVQADGTDGVFADELAKLAGLKA